MCIRDSPHSLCELYLHATSEIHSSSSRAYRGDPLPWSVVACLGAHLPNLTMFHVQDMVLPLRNATDQAPVPLPKLATLNIRNLWHPGSQAYVDHLVKALFALAPALERLRLYAEFDAYTGGVAFLQQPRTLKRIRIQKVWVSDAERSVWVKDKVKVTRKFT